MITNTFFKKTEEATAQGTHRGRGRRGDSICSAEFWSSQDMPLMTENRNETSANHKVND